MDKGLSFCGTVVKGSGRGRELGFPTANLGVIPEGLEHGVYAVEVEIEGKKHQGAMFFGPQKTFNEASTLEVHIKDFNRGIYGQELVVRVIKKIREVKKFANAGELTEQIARDLKEVPDK
ncbi:MAG: riboflavin kinase [Candidatus Pacebacteria bacterium]|jgi:riboflavin kinase/FMN adenylyltransferase|nr:riboflavin kinase [Candidatus Paceibacterota bacterium]